MLQESYRQGKQPAGDLVIIVGAGQHSAPEDGPKLRATVERLLGALHLPDGTHAPSPQTSPVASPASEPHHSAVLAPNNGSGMAIIQSGSAASRLRQRLIAFKPLRGLASPQTAAVQQTEPEHDAVSSTASAAAAADAVIAEITAEQVPGQRGKASEAGPWSRSEAARLLTEAIVLDWTTPWPSGSGERRAGGGRGSWPAAAGVRSRVAETTARLGTDWLSAASVNARGGTPMVPSDTTPAEDGTDGAHQGITAAGERMKRMQVSEHTSAAISAATTAVSGAGEGQRYHSALNVGRLVVPRDALMAWLASKPMRGAS